jgi:hypothetical protein
MYSNAASSKDMPLSRQGLRVIAMQRKWIQNSRRILSYRETQWSYQPARSQTNPTTFRHAQSCGPQTSRMISSQFAFFIAESLLVGVGCRKKESRSCINRKRPNQTLQREIALACANFSDTPQVAEAVFGHFWKEIQSFPLEWPSSTRPASEHTWRFGRVVVRYRLIPDAQTVEIISVSGANP